MIKLNIHQQLTRLIMWLIYIWNMIGWFQSCEKYIQMSYDWMISVITW